MSDDVQIGQDEIEELLEQARQEAQAPSSSQKNAARPAKTADDPLAQGEIESLLSGQGNAAAPPAAVADIQRPRQQAAEPPAIAQRDVELLLRQAEEAIASVQQPREAAPGAAPFHLRDFAGAAPSAERSTLELIRDVELDLKIELGRTHLPLEEVLKLRKGSVVPLEKLAGDPVDIFVNGRLIARGEVLVLNDNFCVRVTELIAAEAVA